MFRIIVAAALTLQVVSGAQAQPHKKELVAASGEKAQRIWTHTLRICNAYSAATDLQVTIDSTVLNHALKFRECHDYTEGISSEQKIRFASNGLKIAAFDVESVPTFDSLLLLVIKDGGVFTSHVYDDSDQAQVAIVDTFSAGGQAIITDGALQMKLAGDSVIALNQGLYYVKMPDTPDHETGFKLTSGEKYVIMRTGPGQADIVVFPYQKATMPVYTTKRSSPISSGSQTGPAGSSNSGGSSAGSGSGSGRSGAATATPAALVMAVLSIAAMM